MKETGKETYPKLNNMESDTQFLIDIVLRASDIARQPFAIAQKDKGGDLVTTADLEMERFMIREIETHYPDFDVISEEFNPTNKLTPNCFIIDPLDGTINFAHGLPLWGIQVAMVRKGKICGSVIYLPDMSELYFADKTGAYVTGVACATLRKDGGTPHKNNSTDKTVPRTSNKFHSIISTATPISVNKNTPDKVLYLVEGGDKFPALRRMNIRSRHWRYFCCTAVNSAWTASGKLGGTILRKDNLWDYVPGQYLVEMAGGVVINRKGAHIAAGTKQLARLLLKDGRIE